MKVVTADQMREIEARAAKIGLTSEILMENAGLAVAREVKKYLGDIAGLQILFLIGPGNNGGDGLVAARHLHDWGARISIYLCSQRRPDDKNLKLVAERGVNIISGAEDNNLSHLKEELHSANAVVDGLFGTGKMRPLEGIYKDTLCKLNELRARNANPPLITLDLPSGLNPDNGAIDPACPTADLTITLSSPKLGLYAFPGALKTGKIVVCDIGIPQNLTNDITTELLTDDWVRERLPARPPNANKGTFGRVMVVAGSLNYIGAAYLACEAACRAGAGLVTLATPKSLIPVLAAKLTEVTYLPLPEVDNGYIGVEAAPVLEKALPGYDTLLIGCGIAQNAGTREFIKSVLLSWPNTLPQKIVADADALNILSQFNNWWKHFTGNAVLTPHPGELSRLTGQPIEKIQADRLGMAQKCARDWKKTVILKGAFSVIASPAGQVMLSPVAEPALASAGTGDVLAGIVAGLMAQGVDHFVAASMGVHLHAAAARMVAQQMGHAGVLASDLLPVLPLVLKSIGRK
jgi:NAD(P)H-hydrate epimerase